MEVLAINMTIIWYTLAMMCMDVVTGFMCGAKNNDLSSAKMREGLWHKSAFLAAIVLSVIITNGAENVGVMSDYLGEMSVDVICGYIILTEVISVLENICILNPEIANSRLGKLFKNTKKMLDETETEETGADNA